jgi:hypothetical protein
MRKFKMGLAVLATSAAVIVPAGAASANFLDVDVCNGAHADCVTVPIDVAITDNTVCGLNVLNVSILQGGNWATCGNGKTAHGH